jgi:hypothetical protein
VLLRALLAKGIVYQIHKDQEIFVPRVEMCYAGLRKTFALLPMIIFGIRS